MSKYGEYKITFYQSVINGKSFHKTAYLYNVSQVIKYIHLCRKDNIYILRGTFKVYFCDVDVTDIFERYWHD